MEGTSERAGIILNHPSEVASCWYKSEVDSADWAIGANEVVAARSIRLMLCILDGQRRLDTSYS